MKTVFEHPLVTISVVGAGLRATADMEPTTGRVSRLTVAADEGTAGVTVADMVDLGAMLLRMAPVAAAPVDNGNGAKATGVTEPAEPAVEAEAPEPAEPAEPAVVEPAKPQRRRGRGVQVAVVDAGRGERSYRRRPPVEDLRQVLAECGGSPGAAARKLGVPRHTMAGWLRGLRAAGETI